MRDSPAPIRVLSIIEANTVSGPARLLLDFCRHSQGQDIEPKVSTLLGTFVRAKVESASNEFLEAAATQQLKVHCIHERSALDARAISRLRQLSKELAPDIIETHGTKSHFLVRASGVWRACPWIAFHHGYTMDSKRTLLYNHFDRWSLRVPVAVVTVCEAFRWQLIQRGVPPSRITILHNAISPDWLRGSNCETALPAGTVAFTPGQYTILAVGRLSKEKAFADLISAIDHLRRLQPQLFVRLLILGEGPERTALQRAVNFLQLEGRVQLVGHVRDVRAYLRIADVLAISSVTEGEPMVLLEAMAAGVPVVATSVGGIPDILTGRETGLLVAPRNPAAMAAAIAELFRDRALSQKLAQAALAQMKCRHMAGSRARYLIQLYERVCRNTQLQHPEHVAGACDKRG